MSARFWNKRSQKYEDSITKHDRQYEQTIESTRACLTEDDSVLDFACATGEIGLDIATFVQRVHGVDVSPKMIEIATRKSRERGAGNVSFGNVSIFDASLEGGAFSAVTAFNILHLVEDAAATLDRLHELLADDGLLISQTPCLGERAYALQFLIGAAQRVGMAPPIRSLAIAELESLVRASGFTITASRMCDEKNAVWWILARKR